MGKYVLKRFGAMLITLFFVMVLSFMIVRLMPMNIFENPETPKAIQDKLNEQLEAAKADAKSSDVRSWNLYLA